MRLDLAAFVKPIVACAIVAVLTLPCQARKSETKNSNISGTEAETSSRCNASQIGPDGAWVQVPCRAVGSETSAPPKTSAGNDGEGAR
jgi:hypothetical protein